MYKKIDDFYKKNSIYKKIKFWTFILAFLATILLLLFSTTQYYFIPLIVIFVLASLIMKRVYEKILDEKLYFNFNNKNGGMPLDDLINKKEKNMLVQYLKDNNLCNKDSIKCILDHYRCFIKIKVVNGNFLAIFSIIITIILTFVNKEGFDVNSFSASMPYILILILIFILIYYPISKIIALKKFFTGEDGLEEHLESIFSELYIEYEKIINENNDTKTLKIKSKKRKINSSKKLIKKV